MNEIDLKDIKCGDTIVLRCWLAFGVHRVWDGGNHLGISVGKYVPLKYPYSLNGQYDNADPHLLDIVKVHKDTDRMERMVITAKALLKEIAKDD